jgi:hypothetical protein
MTTLHNMSDEVYQKEILRPTDNLYDENGDETATARAVSLAGFRPIEEAYDEMMADFKDQFDQVEQTLKARQAPAR